MLGSVELRSFLDGESRPSFVLSGAKPHYNPDRPGQVEHIFLDLNLDLQQQQCWGTCQIRLNPIVPGLEQLTLDAVNQNIKGVWINDQSVNYSYDGEQLIIALAHPPTPGQPITIKIDYHLDHPQRGLYFVLPNEHYPHKPIQAWTQGEDEDSRFWFPCFDYPGQLATSEIRVRVPQPYMAISNGELRGVEDHGDHKIYHWYQPQVHPTYLMTLAVGEFTELQDSWQGKPVTYYVTPGREADGQRTMGKTPQMIEFFSQKYGYNYPYPKYAQVCVDDFIFGGMENTSTTLLTDRCLLDERAALDNRNSESLVAHELAHQWFGDLVVIKHWSHAWIKEGMASYSEIMWTEQEYGADEAAYYRLGEIRNYLHEDSSRYRRPIVTHIYREAIELYDRHLYEKGACVYHMIRAELGEDLFWKAIHTFVQDNAHKTVETIDLLRAIEKATGRNLMPLFDQYVFRGGHPDYKVVYRWDSKSKLAVITVTQTQASKEGTSPLERGLFDLDIPLGFGFVADSGEVTSQTLSVRIHEPEQSFYIPLPQKPQFISFDVGNHTLKTVTLEYPLPELKSQLKHDPEPLSRINAAKALAKKGGLEAVIALAHGLEMDPFWGVRVEIAKQLGTIKLDQALHALAIGLQDTEARVRRACVDAITSFKSTEAYQLIKAMAIHGDASYLVEAAALRGIGEIAAAKPGDKPKPKKVFKILETALEERSGWNEVVRAGAIGGLGALKELPEAVDLVLDYTQLGIPQPLRLAAIRTLGTLGKSQTPELLERILNRVQHLSTESFFLTQVAVISALSQMDSSQALGLLRHMAEQCLDGRVKRAADEGVAKVQKAIGNSQALKTVHDDLADLKKQNQKLLSRLEQLEAQTKANQTEDPNTPVESNGQTT
ncbi:M1 family metallopeptidase [Synechococcus sp. PCC 6312]|uniref:M1 family metallopeptidase n=1 Tax=Synechococcus sp. (strain ATCC 27167 / PCC 6312) TaxID=195253 RepID=UPI00029F32A7|nr:M1 family metallopeptidase [Synechococcus sp. PCC 6312]AFY60791.1 aminopeptidase N [Synechococcus sp. PCC 6312]